VTEQTRPKLSDAEKLKRFPICSVALPGCAVTAVRVVPFQLNDRRVRLTACERCANRVEGDWA
jgi:hypothetical protein